MKTGTKNLVARRGFMKAAFFATTLVAGAEAHSQDIKSPPMPTVAFSPVHVALGPSIGAAGTDVDADDVFTLDDPMQAFHCRLNGSVSTVVRVVLTKTKKYPIVPVMIGSPSIYTEGRLVPLFTNDGTVDTEQLAGDSAVIHVEVADVLASQELSSQLYAALESDGALLGKAWAQPRVRKAIRVTLNWTDPLNGNQQRAIATCNLHRKDGQVAHELYFRIDNEVDLAALKSATRKQLSLEMAVDAYCRVSHEIAIGQSSVIAASTVATANELLSKAGEDICLIMATGGGLESRAAILSAIKRRVEFEITLRKGEQIPTEIINGILDRIIGSALQTVNLQAADQQQRVAFIIGNQLLVTAPIGELRGALSSIKKLVETNDTHDVFSGKKQSVSGGASFMGIGASASVSTEEQRREMTNKLRRDLDEATENFSAALPTVTAMDAKHLNNLAATDSATIDLVLSRFSIRWQPLVTDTSLEITHDAADRLHKLIEERDSLMEEILEGVQQIKLNAEVDSTTALEAKQNVADVRQLKNDVLNDAIEVRRYGSYKEFAMHLKNIGHGDDALKTYHVHMSDKGCGKPTRAAYVAERQESLNRQQALFEAEFSAATKQIDDLKTRSNDRGTKAEALVAKITRLHQVSSEIETSLRLGVK